ncbi:hypothetical protein BDR03DRAFT_229876 [Suillus americanus]|nr:hypothetical protein BDR03DRAFT_229876 [Suillus americanus]
MCQLAAVYSARRDMHGEKANAGAEWVRVSVAKGDSERNRVTEFLVCLVGPTKHIVMTMSNEVIHQVIIFFDSRHFILKPSILPALLREVEHDSCSPFFRDDSESTCFSLLVAMSMNLSDHLFNSRLSNPLELRGYSLQIRNNWCCTKRSTRIGPEMLLDLSVVASLGVAACSDYKMALRNEANATP